MGGNDVVHVCEMRAEPRGPKLEKTLFFPKNNDD